MQQQWRELLPMIEAGVIKPPIGATYEMDGFGQALIDMDERKDARQVRGQDQGLTVAVKIAGE